MPIARFGAAVSYLAHPALIADYVVNCVVATVQFAMDKSWGSSSDPMSLKQPTFVCFVRSVLKMSRCPSSTVFVALVYLDRARMQMRISRGDWACERAFLGALMLANKVRTLGVRHPVCSC